MSPSPSSSPPGSSPHDLVVLSDLHMGRGLNVATGRYHRLETFFHDGDFERFCGYLCAQAERTGRAVRLILNGDTFDFLRTEALTVEPERSTAERRPGPYLAPGAVACLAEEILRGHPRFLDGLVKLLRSGHEVVLLPGNHDIELQWRPVQEAIRAQVRERVIALGAEPSCLSRFVIKEWFHHEPGRIWVEHGCQYDPENAFQSFLRAEVAERPDVLGDAEHDIPLGNFFQRYLYNGFGSITFIVPSARANSRYLKWFLLNEPRFLVGVLVRHLPFALQLVRRMARAAASFKGGLRRMHEAALDRLAKQSELGDALFEIDRLKSHGAEVVTAVRETIRQLFKLTLLSALVAFTASVAWAATSYAISAMQIGFGGKAVLSVAVNFLLLALALGAGIYWLLRVPRAAPARTHRRAAEQIARVLDVPLVTFGHTHDEEVWAIDRYSGRGWYFNTGTWVTVFTHDVLLPRDKVQFTFLSVVGDRAELLHFSPGRNEPLPVILLDEHGPAAHPLDRVH